MLIQRVTSVASELDAEPGKDRGSRHNRDKALGLKHEAKVKDDDRVGTESWGPDNMIWKFLKVSASQER